MGENNLVDPQKDPMKEFKERISNKIRDDIAGLLPEEAVQAMVAEVIQREFFKEQKINNGSVSYPRWESKPSVFTQEVLEASKPIMQKAIKEAVLQNKEKIDQAVDQFLEAQNLTLLAAAAISTEISLNNYSVIEGIIQRLKNNNSY